MEVDQTPGFPGVQHAEVEALVVDEGELGKEDNRWRVRGEVFEHEDLARRAEGVELDAAVRDALDLALEVQLVAQEELLDRDVVSEDDGLFILFSRPLAAATSCSRTCPCHFLL